VQPRAGRHDADCPTAWAGQTERAWTIEYCLGFEFLDEEP